MSSWDSYIDSLMVDLPNGGQLTSAAVLGQDGGVWTASEKFPAVTPEQVLAIMAGFSSVEEKGHAGDLGTSGIRFGDEKFQVCPGDDTAMRGKSKDGGCCIKRTATALVVGIYTNPVVAGDCNVLVEKIGEHLAESGY